jgi:hypothetical protein
MRSICIVAVLFLGPLALRAQPIIPPAPAIATLTDASPLPWNVASVSAVSATVTLSHSTGTRALNVSNLVTGGFYTLILKQDSTGGAAMTLGSGCTWKVGGGGSGAITLTSTGLAIDILAFFYDGTNCYANFQTNFN